MWGRMSPLEARLGTLPVDPTEYQYKGAVWRGLFFFFSALMFGLRHSGLQRQKVSYALAWIHRNQGLEYLPQEGGELGQNATLEIVPI